MKKNLLVCAVAAFLFSLLQSNLLAQDDRAQIKTEIQRHKKAIHQLEQKLQSANQDVPQEYSSEGYSEEGYQEDAGSDINESGSSGLRDKAQVNRPWEKAADANKDGIVDQAEMQQFKQKGPGNPPGPKGGPGAGMGNPPGPKGGPGKSNPPGHKGGPGKGNPPGHKGGPGKGRGHRPQ